MGATPKLTRRDSLPPWTGITLGANNSKYLFMFGGGGSSHLPHVVCEESPVEALPGVEGSDGRAEGQGRREGRQEKGADQRLHRSEGD